jgi:creatinine amidohydrolase/Fe(II)-dependent formamide hydrolase-like protein
VSRSTKIAGADEVRRKIRNMQDAVSKTAAKSELKTLHGDAAKIVEQDALGRAPVKSGRLRESIRSSGTQKAGVVRAGFARVPYAGPIHFGWAKRNIRPQPFLYDAKDARRDEVVRSVEQGIDALIRRFDLD